MCLFPKDLREVWNRGGTLTKPLPTVHGVLDEVLLLLVEDARPRKIREIASALGLERAQVIAATRILAHILQFVKVDGEVVSLKPDARSTIANGL